MSVWRPYVIAFGMVISLALITYFAFHPRLPFSTGYRVGAVFESSNGLRKGSPVRIAGVDSGKVAKISKGPGSTTIVTMELQDSGRPVHRDAVARIRPRVFLEGGFMVELQPGSPSAPEMPDDGTIPLSQTSLPVQFHQVLGTFDAPARDSLRGVLDTTARGLDGGGAEGLRALAPELEPLLRDTAWVAQALRGEQSDDLSALVRSTSQISAALDDQPGRVGDLVANLAATARSFRERSDDLEATIAGSADLVEAAPRAMRAVDAALPLVERSARDLTPALGVAPRAFRRTTGVLRELGLLVAPGRRARTIAALETALRDLPTAVVRLGELFPAVKPVTDCLSSHVVPIFEAEVPDGKLSTNRPAWQDFAHGLVGLSSASQVFDGNGYHLRYQFGLDGESVSTAALPGLGRLVADAPSNLRSRPLPSADRKPPPHRPDVPCSTQKLPSLETPEGPAGLSAAQGSARDDRKPIPLNEESLSRILSDENVRRSLEGLR